MKPTPEAIAADIHATASAHRAGVITSGDKNARLASAWATASLHALTDATVRALATIEANARPFGPGTLDVLLAAETTDPGAVCDAIEAIAGDGSWAGVLERGAAGMNGRGFVVNAATLAALVRALRGVAP